MGGGGSHNPPSVFCSVGFQFCLYNRRRFFFILSPKCNTGLDRKSTHMLLFITRKQGHCTAISPGGTFIFHILVHVLHLRRADSITNPVFAFFGAFGAAQSYQYKIRLWSKSLHVYANLACIRDCSLTMTWRRVGKSEGGHNFLVYCMGGSQNRDPYSIGGGGGCKIFGVKFPHFFSPPPTRS